MKVKPIIRIIAIKLKNDQLTIRLSFTVRNLDSINLKLLRIKTSPNIMSPRPVTSSMIKMYLRPARKINKVPIYPMTI